LQDDVKGSYGRASEQIKFVHGHVDSLKGALRFQGVLTIIISIVAAVAIVKVLDHNKRIRDESWIEERAGVIAEKLSKKYSEQDKIVAEQLAEQWARKLRRSDQEITALAEAQAKQFRRTDEEIKGIALANNPS